MSNIRYELGTVEASEEIIQDLYLSLRTQLFKWSRVTKQTPQPKMGYIGQHLTSVVTGFPGGRSGARGKDLVLPNGMSAEIKTCYRVDQLGSCRACGALVAAVETQCAVCYSDDVKRKDDSKWLLKPRNDDEMAAFFDPASYYFVLFDFEDLDDPTEINVRIWDVDPRTPGFVFAITDYYVNIGRNSASSAPFNLWPYSLKFQLMRPTLIYHSKIDSDNNVDTLIFPGLVGAPVPAKLDPLTTFKPSTGFKVEMAREIAAAFGASGAEAETKSRMLDRLHKIRERDAWDDDRLLSVVTEAMYGPLVADHNRWFPEGVDLTWG